MQKGSKFESRCCTTQSLSSWNQSFAFEADQLSQYFDTWDFQLAYAEPQEEKEILPFNSIFLSKVKLLQKSLNTLGTNSFHYRLQIGSCQIAFSIWEVQLQRKYALL